MQVQNSQSSFMSAVKVAMTDQEKINKGQCPDCDNSLQFEEGCKKCRVCGFAACG